MESYIQSINQLKAPSFELIKAIASGQIAHLSSAEKDSLWNSLDRGLTLLNSHEQMCQYLHSYGNMHQAKLQDAFAVLPDEVFENGFEIVDWGCGQGMGTINLFDYLNKKGIDRKVEHITLIEPAEQALARAKLHIDAYLSDKSIVRTFAEYFESITADQIPKTGKPVVHIFSNILDVPQIDLKHLAQVIDSGIIADNYLVCVGPLNPNNLRIDAFYNYFDVPLLYDRAEYQFNHPRWTYKCKVYKLSPDTDGNLVPIEFYPSVQFHAAYELDSYRIERKASKDNFFDQFSVFEISAPFDIGASVYEDVHPVLAVLNNIITRGLPTKASIYLEEVFSSSFKNSRREVQLGEICYLGQTKIDYPSITGQVKNKLLNGHAELADHVGLQELMTPIAVARLQKIMVEAIITGHLDIHLAEWNVLVEEHDVPCSALALKDFSALFHNLCQLSEDFGDLKLPKINLDIISNPAFMDSPLHLNGNVSLSADKEHFAKTYHIVIDMAILELAGIQDESFSKFKCHKHCYFKIRSIAQKKTQRTVYTSSLIKYKKLVEKNNQGEYLENEQHKAHLSYFLQLIFRKESFRPGQLPILDRALQNLPVIGLLPTGGGKSLTYQIAALLQAGITLIIDPLRSLMKDQYDGLINNGIDFCTYINASVPASERADREKNMEASRLLFVFVSPERLSILNFRERLKQMHDYNVYFSYGVIDEVHCVSEWGHDFRFSYLHLGRNLYNYVKAKSGEISLFGLTATASFDVLADVERELSGNAAFALDSETIVRYENTNRLELQYKIETVPVAFAEDTYYDPNNTLDASLPKAINVGNNWPLFNSKSEFLKDYISKIPTYINELQVDKNVEYIKTRFSERQNNQDNLSNELRVEMPDNFYQNCSTYQQAGIVFCPHVKGTGISVEDNKIRLQGISEHIGSFSGSDTDDSAMENLERFRENQQPIMVATKAFGMGIDKPNVRFTINMNYSSSLESFVQEAGRAGRDRKMALSVILVSDYLLAKVNRTYPGFEFPLNVIKNKWFHKKDLEKILNHYNLSVPEAFIELASPNKDVVKLHCSKDNRMFAFNRCDLTCTAFNACQLRKVSAETKGWHSENELVKMLNEQGISLNRKHYQYLSADYSTVMYFFNASFKGDIIEKTFMHQLLSSSELQVSYPAPDLINPARKKITGFLSTLIDSGPNAEIIVFVPYTAENSIDISKAIYRMCCIELIDDFTQDYTNSEYRILVRKRKPEAYFKGLENFLLRYYTPDRALLELEKAKKYPIKVVSKVAIVAEIHRCLAYLTEFVYDKISEKRKRAIDDMRNFCVEGSELGKPWMEKNENLKDYIFYYFNSKYAKSDYIADNNEPYSLTEDTDGGKISDNTILFKYLKVIEDHIVGVGTPIDNVKHLQGAVRLIRRSLTDSNPTLSLLYVFTLAYLGTKKNANLEEELRENYKAGMQELAIRMQYERGFWEVFESYNQKVARYNSYLDFEKLIQETKIIIHGNRLHEIVEQYTQIDE